MPDADGFCPMADAAGNYNEALRCLRAALLEQRARSHLKGNAQAGGRVEAGRKGPASNSSTGGNDATR